MFNTYKQYYSVETFAIAFFRRFRVFRLVFSIVSVEWSDSNCNKPTCNYFELDPFIYFVFCTLTQFMQRSVNVIWRTTKPRLNFEDYCFACILRCFVWQQL